jgi:flagellar assembly factor FliW
MSTNDTKDQNAPMDQPSGKLITVQSSRFGPMEIAEDSIITFSKGLIGFPDATKFVMFDHKPPFAWLHSIEDQALAFVVMDGSQFLPQFELAPPHNEPEMDLKDNDDYAILVVVTVRGDPTLTTANIKAPLFVNLRNRRGAQVIYDDPNFPTRFALYKAQDKGGEEKPKG